MKKASLTDVIIMIMIILFIVMIYLVITGGLKNVLK